MGEQVTISKEEYESLLRQAQSQEKLFSVIENMQNQISEMKAQMESFSLHFGRMYASQSIEETLQAMGDLGKYEIGADECKIYSVDVYDKNKIFTVNEDGSREYTDLSKGGLLKKAIETHSPINNDYSFKEFNTNYGSKNHALYVPLENQQGEVIGIAYARGKAGGFTEEDIKAFDLKDGKIGNAFRMGLENKALQQKATTDELTHLMNREGMFNFIKSEAYNHVKHDEPVSVILFDIDRFKKFNDTYGHDVGDECLKKVASVLQDNIRQSADSGVFRWGGEEMLVIVPVDENKANEIANRLRKAIESSPIEVNGEKVPVTVSGGIAEFQGKTGYDADKGSTIAAFHEAFSKADAALYFSKEHGRNQICKSGDIESEIMKNVDLTQNLVADQHTGNLWINKEDMDMVVTYSSINKENNPDVISTLLSRAENYSENKGSMIEGFKKVTENGNIAVNFVASDERGVSAELESTDYGNLVTVPLTENEQAAVKQEMVIYMVSHNIEVPEFMKDKSNEPEKDLGEPISVDIPEKELDDAFYEGTKDEVQAQIDAMQAENDLIFDMPMGIELKDIDHDYEGDDPAKRIEEMLTFKVGEKDGKDLLADMYAGQNRETGENIVYNMDGDKAYIDGDRTKLFDIPSDVIKDMEEISDKHITLAANAEKELGEDWHKVAYIDENDIKPDDKEIE